MMTFWQFTAYWLSLAGDPMVKWLIIAVLAYMFGYWWRGFNVSSFVRKHL